METPKSIVNPSYAKFYVCVICNRKIHEDYMLFPDAIHCDNCCTQNNYYTQNNVVDIIDYSQIYGDINIDIDSGDIMCLLLALCIFS